MAVKSFATNYLVADHDMYKEFMNNRFEYLKKNNIETDVLFCNVGKNTTFLPNGKNSVDDQNSYAAICKWHCITISYNIWCNLVSEYVKEDNRVANYKKFVNVPVDVLKKFKYRVEKSIENAKCDYNKRLNGGHGGSLNACRYLAMFWTYLDLKKDCKTQRYFPDFETIRHAANIFGYADNENPFEMNGKYTKRAERKVLEEKPMEQTEQIDKNGVALLVDIIDDRRLTNPLKRADIQTVGEFLAKSDEELLKIRTFGVAKLKAVKKAVYEYVNKTKEESVIDIAERAAKEVEEERKGLDVSVKRFKGYPYLHVNVDNTKRINDLNEKLEKAKDIVAHLQNTLNEKNLRIAQLEGAIEGSKKRIDGILEENAKLNNALNSYKSNDILRAVGRSIDLMKEENITELDVCISGYSVKIVQKYVIVSKEAGRGRV